MKWLAVKRNTLILSAAFLFAATEALAQTGTTSLHGVVLDSSHGAVAGAKVTLSNLSQALERQALTSDAGEYEFLALPPGTYSLTIERSGFNKFEQKNIQLLVNSPTTLNATLQVGTAVTTVEVSAGAVALNTTDASIGIAFNENQVKELPLEGRNVPDLLTLQPGVAYTGNRPDLPASDTRSGAVNGSRSDQSNVTLDGQSVNDEGYHAFTSVLPVTLDSVEEFRVTTSNANADQGGSSGAQVALVTKSGTNDIHGSAYEYHRNTYTSANDYFIKSSELANCTLPNIESCNVAPKLIRNIFGASLGGPVKKDRLYFFLNYEGTRRAEAVSEIRQVPSASLRDGVIFYQCDTTTGTTATDCPGNPVGVKGNSGTFYPIPAPVVVTNPDGSTTTIAYNALSSSQIMKFDPQNKGVNSIALAYMNSLPAANVTSFGDGFNYQGFNFAAPISDKQNVYIAKMDFNVTRDGKHRISVSGALRNDNNPQAPFFPGEAPAHSFVNFSKGIIVNYSGVLKQSLLNSFRYAFIRESFGDIGNSNQQWVELRGLNDQTDAITRTHSFQRPTNTFADDVSWIRGHHTWQFGGVASFIRNPRISFNSAFSDAIANTGWTSTSGFAGKNSPLNPANNINPATGMPYPGVDSSFFNSYDFPIIALMGMVTEVDAQYNFARSGSALPQGAPLTRHFAINTYELYAQDVWKIKPTITLTLGLRYSLFRPPWETNGLQVTPTFNLGKWFEHRAFEGANGIPSNQDQPVAFNWSGPANGGHGSFWDWDYKDLGPRVAFAWAPNKSGGLLGSLFGPGKTSIRAGFGIVYDRFGQGIIDDFDRNGSFGLATLLSNNAVTETPAIAPRLGDTVGGVTLDLHTFPTVDLAGNQMKIPAPTANFPQPFPSGNFTATTGLDSGIKTPYAYTIDLSVGRELRGGFSLEVAYVGRLSHRLLTSVDIGTPLNFKDPKSGVDYFTAVKALAQLYRAGVKDETFSNSLLPANVVQYWQNVVSPLNPGGAYAIGAAAYPGNGSSVALTGGCIQPSTVDKNPPTSTTNPVLAAFDGFCGANFNETLALQFWDSGGMQDAGNATLTCQNNPSDPSCHYYFPSGGPFTFYTPQYSALYAWRSIGAANYHALQASLRHKMSHGVQFDFNYTYSKSIDLSSDAERVGTFGAINASFGGSWVINPWSPFQLRGVSDFDATHQFNANWILDLPFGRGRTFGHDTNRALDAVIGGWQLSGLFRLTSGFPVSIFNGFNFPTNWFNSGNAVMIGPALKTGAYKNSQGTGSVNLFAVGGTAAAASFREPFPGESGQRNNFRGDGFFGVDLGLSKRWKMPWKESHSLQLRWEVFNVGNSQRFDAQSTNNEIDTFGPSFGNYTRLLTNPRVMQFALRYEF